MLAGLVSKVVPADTTVEVALGIANKIASFSQVRKVVGCVLSALYELCNDLRAGVSCVAHLFSP